MNFNMKQQFWLEVVAVETDTQAHHSTEGNIKNYYIDHGCLKEFVDLNF